MVNTAKEDGEIVTNKRHKKRKFGISEFLILLVFLIGFGVMGYPTVSDYWNRYRNSRLITQYDESVEELNQEEYEAMFQDAYDYNSEHHINVIRDSFSEEEMKAEPADGYYQLLDPAGDGIMGYISIPKIQQDITIYHGTSTEVLEKGVGHVEGTSLPVGGWSTHAVIAGHRGLPNAKLFTDLDQLEEGDLFFLHILNQVLAYQVNQIFTVLPDETEALAIEDGKDYVTLLTCTPYGVNTHRLLIRGVRTEYDPGLEEDNSLLADALMGDRRVLVLLAGLAIFIVIVIFMFRGNRKKERNGMK